MREGSILYTIYYYVGSCKIKNSIGDRDPIVEERLLVIGYYRSVK